MERLFDDPALARAMARNGRERLLERYTWDRIAAAARTAYLPNRKPSRLVRYSRADG